MTSQTIPFIGGFESTYLPAHDRDVFETTAHDVHWRADLDRLQACGVGTLRYPIRWHRIEQRPGRFDWACVDPVLEHLAETGTVVIADLVHHTSYPRWLEGGFGDPRFGPALLRFVERFAERYPWIPAYQVLNEPFATLLLCAHEGLWPPYHRGMRAFVAMLLNVMPPFLEATRRARELLPDAWHLYGDSCEHHSSAGREGAAFAAVANDRRFFLLDVLLGHELDEARPFVAEVVAAGGRALLDLEPGHVDVLGLDYYAHNQWQYWSREDGIVSAPDPLPLADVIEQYWHRYRLPLVLGETNVRGFASDRATWLKYTLEQCEMARERGVPLNGYCWFPFVDSCDWDSLLYECRGSIDPVGAFWLDERRNRHASSMSRSYALAASGTPSSELPAYRLQPPVSDWLRGWLHHVPHWEWQEPPRREIAVPGEPARIELRIRTAA